LQATEARPLAAASALSVSHGQMSKRLSSLGRAIADLRRHFLPTPFDPLGNYRNAKRVQARTRAYLVLCHAEVESFVEEWAKEIARASENAWKKSGRLTQPLAFLVFTLSDGMGVPESLSSPKARIGRQSLSETLSKILPEYYKRIKDNNGIKEKNILNLFGPMGIDSTAFPATLFPNLDAFGAARGEHAHHSARAVTSAIDPETEFKRVSNLLTELAVLDSYFVKWRQSIR
jgi:hypothetical protein